MTEWTPRQKEAITARNRQILVSAAAGSGKTAVLIERVMGLLRDGMQLDRMLVVTFTRAAAEEMKERLAEKLQEEALTDARMRAQYLLLGRADISTLHSFCQKLLKRYFQAAEIDPLFSLTDEAVQQELYTQAVEDALDAFYEQPEPGDQQLINSFTEDEIVLMIRTLLDFLLAQQAPKAWLEQYLTEEQYEDLYQYPWYQVLLREARLLLSGARDAFAAGRQLCLSANGPGRYLNALEDDLALIDLLLKLTEAEGIFPGANPSYTRLPSQKAPPEEDPDLTQKVKDLRQQGKDLVAQALELLPQGAAQAGQWMAEVKDTMPQLKALSKLALDVQERYFSYKQQRQLLDFSDLEHLSIRALGNQEVRQEVARAYDALFVDEYQDVSQIQEAIIKKLQGPDNTLFMVGDVKQSIYRFRLADPGLFLHKSRAFSLDPDADSRLITLKENFRSRENILKAVNLVFANAMRQEVTEIDYDDEAQLVTLNPTGGPPVELWLLEKNRDSAREDEQEEEIWPADGEDSSPEDEENKPAAARQGEMEQAFVYEARLIAKRIRELLGTPLGVNGEDGAVRYRDIAVLLRTASSRAPIMADILSQAGIPAYSDSDGGFFAQQSVKDAMALMEVLENPKNDIPLLHALACPAFSYTPWELADIRLKNPGRDVPFYQAFFDYAQTDARSARVLEQLDRWRHMAESQPLERFVRNLLRQSGLYSVAGAAQDGQLRRANLRILIARAAPNPKPQDLSGFLQRLKAGMEQSSRDRSASLGLKEDVVRVMTMHKSKGLQFPVVFLPDLAASFVRKRRSTPLYLDAQMGLALEQVNVEARYKKDGVGVTAIKTKRNREELSEEARLLYVGMTRAKERLILIGAPASLDQSLARFAQPPGEYATGFAVSMLDWVCNPVSQALTDKKDRLYQAPDGSQWQIGFVNTASLPREKAPGIDREKLLQDYSRAVAAGEQIPGDRSEMGLLPEPELEEGSLEELEAALFRLPPLGEALPQKISVTALVRGEYLLDDEETPDSKRHPWPGPGAGISARRAGMSGDAGQSPKDTPGLSLPDFYPPGFKTPLTAAQRGAAAHKALCALPPEDFVRFSGEELKKAVEAALDRLLERNLLSEPERQGIRTEDVAAFYKSPLARRMAESPSRQAEWPFTLLVEDRLILQGVLDACFVENDQWVLVDYKTDWGEPQALLERYRDQMRWYMRALRDITGMPVKEAWLYLLRRGEAVPVTEEEAIRLADMRRKQN